MDKKLDSFLRKEIGKIRSTQFIEQLAFEQVKDILINEEDYKLN